MLASLWQPDLPTPNVTDTLNLFKSVGQITLNTNASHQDIRLYHKPRYLSIGYFDLQISSDSAQRCVLLVSFPVDLLRP